MATGKGFDKSVISTAAVHHRIHQGSMFAASFADQAVVSAGITNILVRTISVPHVRFIHKVTADYVLEIFEDPTTSADGVALLISNRNRLSVITHDLLAFSAPTITADGTLFHQEFTPGGSGGSAQGGSNEEFGEWILKPASQYLFRFTNQTAQVQGLHVELNFYEPPEGRPFP